MISMISGVASPPAVVRQAISGYRYMYSNVPTTATTTTRMLACGPTLGDSAGSILAAFLKSNSENELFEFNHW